MVSNLLAKQQTWLPSLGEEDPWEKGMATHSSILVWRIPWTKKLCSGLGVAKSRTRLKRLSTHTQHAE